MTRKIVLVIVLAIIYTLLAVVTWIILLNALNVDQTIIVIIAIISVIKSLLYLVMEFMVKEVDKELYLELKELEDLLEEKR